MRFHIHFAKSTDQFGGRLCPGVLSAVGAGEFLFALWSLGARDWEAVPVELLSGCQEFFARPIERTTGDDVMVHLLSGAFSAWLARVGGHESDLIHFPAPAFVMIATARRPVEVLLPQVRHLMNQGGENVLIAATLEVIRIEGDLISASVLLQPMCEAIRVEIAQVSFSLALHNDQAFGKGGAKKLFVEKAIGAIERLVFLHGHGHLTDLQFAMLIFVSYHTKSYPAMTLE